jgi:hypothetical protein
MFQAGLELVILLPLPPYCWDYRWVSLGLKKSLLFITAISTFFSGIIASIIEKFPLYTKK